MPSKALGPPICMQLLKLESIIHYKLSLATKDTMHDQYVCIESMKLSLLAKSCLCPGLVVLIANLIKSSAEPDEYLKGRNGVDWDWLKEYWNGMKYEIYKVPLSPAYANK